MKVVYVVLGILFVASTAQAQIPLYPYLYSQPYAYSAADPFSQPYMGPYYFLSPFSAPAQFAAQYSNMVTAPAIDLTGQVAELQPEVKLLQDELALAQAQAQRTPPPSIITSATEGRPKPVALVFKNGLLIESRGYAIAG